MQLTQPKSFEEDEDVDHRIKLVYITYASIKI